MESAITGIIITVITEITKKYNISSTTIVVWLCLFWWLIYTAFSITNPNFLQELSEFLIKSYATSQALYMIYNKLYNSING